MAITAPGLGRARPVALGPTSVTRRGKAVLAVGLAIVFLLGALGVSWPGLAGSTAPASATGVADSALSPVPVGAALALQGLAIEHTVLPGDTIWDLAVAVDPVRDPRLTVEYIREINGLSTAALEVGQRLWLPVAAQR